MKKKVIVSESFSRVIQVEKEGSVSLVRDEDGCVSLVMHGPSRIGGSKQEGAACIKIEIGRLDLDAQHELVRFLESAARALDEGIPAPE